MKRRMSTPEADEAAGLVETGTITKIGTDEDGRVVDITSSNGWSCGYNDGGTGVVPKVGDTWTTYGQIGYAFHGVALNGRVLWYLTPEEEEAKRQRELAEMDAKRQADFEANRNQLDRDYDALPPLFKVRIDRFRKANEDFRWKYEGYEMFVCSQAVAFAEWAQTPEALDAWAQLPYDKQREMCPDMADGHSGNTFGCAVALAREYLTHRERVPLAMGAMAPIVGTADYSEIEA